MLSDLKKSCDRMGECRVAVGARPSAVWAMLWPVSGYPQPQGSRPEEQVNQSSGSELRFRAKDPAKVPVII